MRLAERDLLILQMVSKFGQLTSVQLQALLFHDAQTTNPLYRALNRLLADHYLARIERRLVGGAQGGSGHYVWQLGLEGWKLCREGRYLPARSIHAHTLAIADLYVMLVNLERAGRLRIIGYSTEPDCHVTIDRYELKPDLYVELARADGSTIRLMMEVDQGSQGQRQITAKFARYWNAHQASNDAQWPDNQLVIFVAIDDRRAQELKWLLDRGAPEQRQLFRVQTAAGLASALAA